MSISAVLTQNTLIRLFQSFLSLSFTGRKFGTGQETGVTLSRQQHKRFCLTASYLRCLGLMTCRLRADYKLTPLAGLKLTNAVFCFT